MASLLNIAQCGNSNNVGLSGCGSEPDFIQFLCFVPKGTEIPSSAFASQAAFATYLNGKLQNDVHNSRFFITPLLGQFKDNTDAMKTVDFDGFKVLSQLMPYNFEWSMVNGGKCGHQKLKGFHLQQDAYDVFLIDKNNKWIGSVASTAGAMAGLSLAQIIVSDWMPKKSGDTNRYNITIILSDNTQVNANYAFFDCTTTTASLRQLTDVYLAAGTGTNTASAIYVTGKLGCSSSDYATTYTSTLATASAWRVLNAAGSAVTVSGVTYNSVLQQYVLASSAAFTSGATFTVLTGLPTAMIALSVYAVSETANAYTVTIP